MTEQAEIQWGDSDDPSEERLEAIAAAREIIGLLGISAGDSIVGKVADKILVVVGVAERRQYDLGWSHCQHAITD